MTRKYIKTAKIKPTKIQAFCLKCGHQFIARVFTDEPGNREHLCVNCKETNKEILDHES